MAKLFSAKSYWLLALSILSALVTGCEFKTPATVTPKINNSGEMVQKDILFPNRTFERGQEFCSEQLYQFAWAPLDERGWYGEAWLLQGVPKRAHLNIYWCLTETKLIGYEFNPSYKDQRAKATSVVEIPVTAQYYYEKEKDAYQRETNKYIKNKDKDAWMHAPYMDLDFTKMVVTTYGFDITRNRLAAILGTNRAPTIIAVEGIEWDNENKFLGFTAELRDGNNPNLAQSRFRFNFLAFESKSDFPQTPYTETLAKHMNVLHLLGRTLNGKGPEAYAGHWDIRKPVTFYTYGVPEEYMDIVEDSVEEWNRGFVEAGVVPAGQKVLLLNKTPLKYPFDLRYPVINWVSDRRASLWSPLGIGHASSDVQTGEFLYASVTIWGGLIEEIMNRYSSSIAAYGLITEAVDSRRYRIDRNTMFDPQRLSESLKVFSGNTGSLRADLFAGETYENLMYTVGKMEANAGMLGTEALRKQWQNIQAMEDGEAKMAQEQAFLAARAQQNIVEKNSLLASEDVTADASHISATAITYDQYVKQMETDIAGSAMVDDNSLFDMLDVFHYNFSGKLFEPADRSSLEPNMSVMSEDQYNALYAEASIEEIREAFSASFQDLDRTVADAIPGMIEGMQASGRSSKEILRATYRFLLLHEIGHVMGLGHNFKGNVLPHKEEVAAVHYDQLKKQLDDTKAETGTGFVTTTVMDYYNGRTEALMNEKEVNLGPYDIQMLRYLYKAEVPYMSADRQTLVYKKVPDNADIAPTETINGEEYKTAFLPACNDIIASTNLDPYCMRFDRGHNAETIMVNRFKDFNASLMSMLNAFTNSKGGNVWSRQASLWYRSLSEFVQIRSFYDYMRLEIDTNDPYRDAFRRIKSDPKALMAFSQACIDPNKAPNAELKAVFAKLAYKNPEDLNSGKTVEQLNDEQAFTKVRDLCAANKIALDQWAQIMMRKGSDYPTFNLQNRYVPGGIEGGDLELTWDYIWGAYREVGAFPMRLSTLFMVTSPFPYFLWGGLVTVPTYNNAQTRYSYAPLYPQEYSSIIDITVRENLNLGGGSLEEKPEIGSSLMYLNYLQRRLSLLTKDNEARKFPVVYLENLNSMSQFQIQVSPILMNNVTKEGEKDSLVFNYSSTYIDMGKWDAFQIPYAYLLPDRRVIAKGNASQIFLPITKFRYLSDRLGFVWALDLRYYHKHDDPLKGFSVKYGLDNLASKQIENCTQGQTGLSSYFNVTNEDFKGFVVRTQIALREPLQVEFERSLNDAFDLGYYKYNFGTDDEPLRADRLACDDALSSMNVIVGGAALINGWWLPQATRYLNF